MLRRPVEYALDASVGVMRQRLLRLPAFECHLQCAADLFGVQAVVHVMTHDLARPR